MDRSKALLWDVQNASQDVRSFLTNVDQELYLTSPMLRAAVERKLQIIGEALARLSRDDPKTAASIPEIRQIIGFRNVLVHGYAVVEDRTVYEIATQELPDLEVVVTKLLAS